MGDSFDDIEMQTLLAAEEEKLHALRELVDGACEEIMGGRLDRQEREAATGTILRRGRGPQPTPINTSPTL